MKFKKIFQKAAAVVMAAVTVFSVLPATTAFAAVGDVGTISFSHTYDGNGNAMRYNSSANINGYIAGGMGNYKSILFINMANMKNIIPKTQSIIFQGVL